MKLPLLEKINIPLILAPMEGITDYIFRNICINNGADAGISEFISSEAIIRNVEKSLKKMKSADDEIIKWVQIFGNNPSSVAEAAKIAEEHGADIIDLNFGCPVKKVISKGNGAALLKDLPLMQNIAEEVVKSVKIPVTAKTRLGWDFQNIVVYEAASRLQDAGIKALAIHGRTRSQLYGGKADWEPIAKVKKTSKIPIIVNGDINSGESAKAALEITNADAIMIGRAAIGNPWIFNEVRNELENKPKIEIPLKQKIETCWQHISEFASTKNERVAILEMRKHYSHYFKGINDFKPLKIKLMSAETLEAVKSIFNEIESKYF